MRKVWAVFMREARSEIRSRYALNAIGMFAFTTLLVIGFSVGPNISNKGKAALLWLVLLFSAMMGLSRTFVREVEARTQDSLRLTAEPGALLAGKALFNGTLLLAVQAVIVPLYALMTGLPVRSAPLLLTLLVLGNVGLTAASTILAAIVAKAGAKTALFPVLALPILLPLLMALVGGTYAALVPDQVFRAGVGFVADAGQARVGAWEAGASYVRLALAYAGMIGPAGLLLFDVIWEEE